MSMWLPIVSRQLLLLVSGRDDAGCVQPEVMLVSAIGFAFVVQISRQIEVVHGLATRSVRLPSTGLNGTTVDVARVMYN